MARLNTIPLSNWIRYYTNFAEQSLERMQEIVEDLEEDKYTVGKLFGDTARFWINGTTGLWDAMRATSSGPVPTVFLKMHPNSDSWPPQEVYVDVPREGALEKTELICLGGTRQGAQGKAPETDKLDVSWHEGKRGCLCVGFRRIGAKGAPRTVPDLSPGLYQSLIHMDNKLLAIVHLLVTV